MVVATLLTMSAANAGAWHVNIKNSCITAVWIEVTGEHLFWHRVDCSVMVSKGTTATCRLPGAICPFDIQGTYKYDRSIYDLNRLHCDGTEDICCCKNVNVEVVKGVGNSCHLERR